MVKTCIKCLVLKPLLDFPKRKDQVYTYCAACQSEYNRLYRIKHHAKLLKQDNEYYHTHKHEYKQKELKNKPKRQKQKALLYQQKAEQFKAHSKKYYHDNKTEINTKANIRSKKRKQTDLAFKIGLNLRTRFIAAFKNKSKTGSAVRDLGCSIEYFIKYIEARFYSHPITQERMSWDNYGRHGWHFDHIKPLCAFNLLDHEQVKIVANFKNIQPLWDVDHKKKTQKDLLLINPKT